MTGEQFFSNPEKVGAFSWSQFNDSSAYTNARNELYMLRAIPHLDFLKKAIDSLQFKGDEETKIIEVGCGSGNLAKELAGHKKPFRLVSTDISPNIPYLAVADMLSHHDNISFVQADAQALPFDDNSFDNYVSLYNLYHIGDPETAINEAKRVIVPEGTLIFGLRGIENFPKHAKSVDKALEHLGFEPVGSPYASFDSEAAPGVLGEHFEIVPELSYPQELDVSSVRDVRLLSEDWPLYRYSLYGTILAAITAQLGLRINTLEERDALPPELKDLLIGLSLNINEAIDTLVWPNYEAEINSKGYYRETAQDRLITCINPKKGLPLAA